MTENLLKSILLKCLTIISDWLRIAHSLENIKIQVSLETTSHRTNRNVFLLFLNENITKKNQNKT